MRYLVLMYGDEQRWETATEPERDTIVDAHRAFSAAVAERATLCAGEALATADATTTLRPADEHGHRELTDGPYAETVEQLGGFYVVAAPDLDLVTELCHELPGYYTLEIRPVVEVDL